MTDASTEIEAGERFAFGENWRRFLELVDDDRIRAAEQALQDRLGADLTGLTFLDIGSGSGLSSLAARNLGAKVTSFDYDASSVACTTELRRRYRPDDADWHVEQGSALDLGYVTSLGTFDIVYSWGVLHHTGDMWTALGLAADRVAPGGRLWVAIYNDQGRSSRNWRWMKQRYVAAGPSGKKAIELAARAHFARGRVDLAASAYRVAKRLPSPAGSQERGRGMDARRDLIDWIGGYPFEVATPDEVFGFYRDRGFVLDDLRTCAGGIGCNEFVFTRR